MSTPNLRTIAYCSSAIFLIVLGAQVYWLLQIPASNSRELTFWIITSILFLVAAIAMAITIVYFFRQKSWHEVQKDFVDNFIHEFRTPVSVLNIAGNVLLTENIVNQPDRLKKYAGIIKEQSEHLQQKVSSILEFTLSEGKQIDLQIAEVGINTLVVKAIGFVQPLLEEKRASIFFEQSQDTRVSCDNSYVVQVIVNLLDNSLKYSNNPSIKIQTGTHERFCFVSVIDNGIGIDPKYHKEIFRKFFRIPTGNVHNVKGFGIGLNFVKKIMDAHAGRVEVKSATGSGTEMRILLPLS